MKANRTKNQVREVYFVQAYNMKLIKIGVTNDTRRRMISMQTFSPDLLCVLGVEICMDEGRLEKKLHERFAEYREHGEWFHPGPKLLRYIEENTVSLDDATAKRAELVSDARVTENVLKAIAKRKERWMRKNGFAHMLDDPSPALEA